MDQMLRRLVTAQDEVGLESAFYDSHCPNFFMADWRGDDADIVTDCAKVLGLESLAAEWRDEDLFINFDGQEVKVPLLQDVGDRHVTACCLNDVIGPNYELRFLVCSHGSDVLGFAALSTADWRALEMAAPAFIAENFLDPRTLPNVVTELTDEKLPPQALARHERMVARNRKAFLASQQASSDKPAAKPWWRFW